jgi:hypothetical protein
MKGEIVDFNKLRLQNAEQIALGNAPINARGDILGAGGVVVKTQEQVEAEFNARLADAREISNPVNIKDPAAVQAAAGVPQQAPVAKPEVQKHLDVEDANFDPTAETPTPAPAPKARRKIVESD